MSGRGIEVCVENGVRYTVPSYIDPLRVTEQIELRYRVGKVFRDAYASVYFDESRELHIKKRILTPGEMETVRLLPEMFKKYPNCRKITVKVEVEQQ